MTEQNTDYSADSILKAEEEAIRQAAEQQIAALREDSILKKKAYESDMDMVHAMCSKAQDFLIDGIRDLEKQMMQRVKEKHYPDSSLGKAIMDKQKDSQDGTPDDRSGLMEEIEKAGRING